ncbi:hypothetical protein [Bacillus subtilis]|uniref:hypothetical protein n=1 Tax=Bacillus subtilis TaxID=1423 RepID=UPI0016429136|nr:hypothetical protein [Bacillus subtilis]
MGEVVGKNDDLSGCGFEKGGEDFDNGCFGGAVRGEKGVDLRFFNMDGEIG